MTTVLSAEIVLSITIRGVIKGELTIVKVIQLLVDVVGIINNERASQAVAILR